MENEWRSTEVLCISARMCVCLGVCVHMDGEALYHPVQCWWEGDLDREVHMMKYDFTFQAMNHTLSSRCLHTLARSGLFYQ